MKSNSIDCTFASETKVQKENEVKNVLNFFNDEMPCVPIFPDTPKKREIYSI